jgi:hypothetical protein
MDLDFDSFPPESWEGGRGIGSEPAAPAVSPAAAFDDNPFTHWTSAETSETTMGRAWIGYDFGPGREIEIRSFTIRQWDGGERPNTIPVVKLQASSDGFLSDIITVDIVNIAQNEERNTYNVRHSHRARFWRLLADSTTGGGHWGVIELRFSGIPARS